MLWEGYTHSSKRGAEDKNEKKKTKRARISAPKDTEQPENPVQKELLEKIEALGKRLPANTLDQLIDVLGGPQNVAEVRT